MKKFLLKSLLVAVGLLTGGSAWADWTPVFTQNYENSETIATGWDNPNSRLSASQETRSGSTHYGKINAGTTNGATFTYSGLTNTAIVGTEYGSSEQYEIEFDMAIIPANAASSSGAQTPIFTIFDNLNNSLCHWQVTTEAKTAAANSTGSFYLGSSGSETASFTANLTPYFYHITIEAETGKATTMTVKDITTEASSKYTLSESYIYIGKFTYASGKTNGGLCLDDLTVSIYSEGDVVSAPSIAVTGVNGTKRTVTITEGSSLLGNEVTTYYTTNGTNPTSSSNMYSGSFEVSSACTVKAITISSEDIESNVTSLSITAEAVKLGTPTIKRTGPSTYTISVTATTTDGFTAVQTIHYTIGGGSEQTGTSLTGVNGDIVAWATATGFTNSDNAEMTYVKAYELASEATWSYNLNSYPSAHSCTNIADALSTTSKEIQSTTMYNLKEETYPNLYIENGAGWLLRNQANNAWKCQSASQSIGFDNVTTTDVIYLYAAKDQGGNSISSVTNGAVRYSYSDNYYYILPTTDGSVKVTFNTGVSLNTVAVYKQVATATIGDYDYTTFASPYPLDCASLPDGLTAYYVEASKIDKTNSVVTLTKVTEAVAAGTGLLLKGTANQSYNIPVAASGTDLSSTNKMVGCTASTEITSSTENYANFYVLVNGSTAAEFQNLKTYLDIDENNKVTIPAGKAYLDATGVADVRSLKIAFEDAETGINEVNAPEAAANGYYNLAGQRVANPTKGLYIVNGKKVLVK